MKAIKTPIISLLLLFSLFFNISHAIIINEKHDCHDTLLETNLMESLHSMDCGNLCDLHHLFHFTAIIQDLPLIVLSSINKSYVPSNFERYDANIYFKNIKPPIL